MPVIKLVRINSTEGDFVGLCQVRLQPSWHCFVIPLGWYRNSWRRGQVPHYGRWRIIWKLRGQWEEVSAIRTWPDKVLVTPQLIELQGWQGSTRVIMAGRRGARYPLSPPSTTFSTCTNSGRGGVLYCRGFLCSDKTWQFLATFWVRSSDRVEDLKVLRSVPNALNCCRINYSLVSFWW